MIKEVFPGMGIIFSEPTCKNCCCYCTAGDPTADDKSEDQKGEENN